MEDQREASRKYVKAMRKSNDSTSDLRGVFTAITTGVTPERGPLGDGAIEKSERDVAR